MKRQYITPSVFCVKLDTKRTFLNSSPVEVNNEEIDPTDPDTGNPTAGWARDDNDNNRGSVWDNAW